VPQAPRDEPGRVSVPAREAAGITGRRAWPAAPGSVGIRIVEQQGHQIVSLHGGMQPTAHLADGETLAAEIE